MSRGRFNARVIEGMSPSRHSAVACARQMHDRHLIVNAPVRGRDLGRIELVGMQQPQAPPAIELTISSRSGAVEVEVHGEIDAATVDLLCSALDALDDAPKLVIDLSSTVFVDVAGVRALAMCARQRRARGRALLVLRPPESAEAVLRMSPFCADLRWVSRRHQTTASASG